MVDAPVLDIQGGRHPLQELCVGQFIANDTHMPEDARRMKLLTGPNASGKSVYLKQACRASRPSRYTESSSHN
jgi:DNA mismatch repair protein MSH5